MSSQAQRWHESIWPKPALYLLHIQTDLPTTSQQHMPQPPLNPPAGLPFPKHKHTDDSYSQSPSPSPPLLNLLVSIHRMKLFFLVIIPKDHRQNFFIQTKSRSICVAQWRCCNRHTKQPEKESVSHNRIVHRENPKKPIKSCFNH